MWNRKGSLLRTVFVLGMLAIALFGAIEVQGGRLKPRERVGKILFFHESLSINQNQSCASCHDPAWGWTGPDEQINAAGAVYEGSIAGRFGNRKPPSAAYATLSPILGYVIEDGDALFVGGNFFDGRATGERLHNPAADQAQGPFLNPVEEGLPNSACVVYRACNLPSGIGDQLSMMSGQSGTACGITWPDNVEETCASEGTSLYLSRRDQRKSDAIYNLIALLIASYEDSPEVNAFTSKYDYYLAGQVELTEQEQLGLALFDGPALCANCHILGAGDHGKPPLLTDFTYDNIGMPRNPANPWYEMTEFNSAGDEWIDLGLGGFLESRSDYRQFADNNYGKHKVPTLRNVDKRPFADAVKAYGHNGYFKSLEGIVHFYNTRDTKPTCSNPFTSEAEAIAQDCWPEPEVSANLNSDELGDLGLTQDEEAAIVAFLRTLSDGYDVTMD